MTTLDWSGCRNVRDLGGLPTADGGVVQPRRLVRSDGLDALDDDGHASFRAYGVARVVDLRGGTVADAAEHPYAGDPVYVHVPWIDADRDHERDADAERDLADVYRGSLDRNTRRVAAVVRAFTSAPAGPVLVHCAAGKDRTGMAVALLLEAAGVPREHVVADYAASEVHLGVRERLAAHPGPEEERLLAERLWRTAPETLQGALDHLDTSYGGTSAYLRGACGLAGAELDAVRERLTRP